MHSLLMIVDAAVKMNLGEWCIKINGYSKSKV